MQRTTPNENRHSPIRKCILSGEHGTRAQLIRLALGPDGSIAPDLFAKAPGRGAWIGVSGAELTKAQEKGKLAGLLRRAARRAKPGSESLRDDAWWQRVDPQGTLPDARRSLLAEGAYRPRVDSSDVAAVRSWARERYLAMLLERRR